MLGTIVSLAVIVAIAAVALAFRVRRRRVAERTMYVPTHPDIELSQRYGGWDADAYDAGSTHRSAGWPRSPARALPPPSPTSQPFGRR
ncbi:hypothetical protein [uncultured Jatrophihabitans sp.]|uniref:hypothetical protein n=1 Tax=uncultured Jatrophihabitans sp. TaxID=1610747 RepID=UPI0035CA8714